MWHPAHPPPPQFLSQFKNCLYVNRIGLQLNKKAHHLEKHNINKTKEFLKVDDTQSTSLPNQITNNRQIAHLSVSPSRSNDKDIMKVGPARVYIPQQKIGCVPLFMMQYNSSLLFDRYTGYCHKTSCNHIEVFAIDLVVLLLHPS